MLNILFVDSRHQRINIQRTTIAASTKYELPRSAIFPTTENCQRTAEGTSERAGKAENLLAESRRVYGLRPAQGPNLFEFGFRIIGFLRGGAELQNGYAIFLQEHQL